MVSVLNLLCGIGMFLAGISLMSSSVGQVFGEKLRDILSLLTRNKLSGVLTGMLVTGAIQSSCATSVMAVCFVDSAMMSLSGATGIIMGANIGTTVTSLLIAFNFSDIAPLSVFLGAMLPIFARKEKTKSIGMLLVGFGLLFIGMNTMSSAFAMLKDNAAFLAFLSRPGGKLQNVLIGFIMTAIMQSSSATVGILQALAMQGMIGIKDAFYIILGQNIGAVIPVILSSAGTGKTAKQVGIIHLLFNLIGTLIFFPLMEFVPFDRLLLCEGNGSMSISLFHIIFNVVSTILLLPLSDRLIALSGRLVRQKTVPQSKQIKKQNHRG
ncbi:MAG: Na/Pi symporter [Oscillospiraceae bacterium]|nr:Na/Pi symporter [Oscillospiraceae bacterium]